MWKKNTMKMGLILLVGMLLIFSTGFTPTPPSTTESKELTAKITQVDTSRFPKVTVYVSVTDASGAPVEISPSRLVLQENGVVMEPDEIRGTGEIGPLATMLAMDISGSMNSSGKLEAAKDAARAYVDQSRPQDMVGLISFNTRVEYVLPLTSEHQPLMKAIDDLKAKEDTAMYDAMAQAIKIMSSISGRKAVIVLTDGLDNRSKLSPQEVIQMIGPEGLSISTIGLGNPNQSTGALSSLNEPALKAFAAEAGGAYGYAKDAESLRNLYELYGRALQSEYVIIYTSPAKLRDGINRSLSVTLSEKEIPISSKGKPVAYNPGGLVPEVANPASWWVLFALLGGMALLLFVPMLVGRVLTPSHGKGKVKLAPVKKSSRIKLK